MDEFKLILTFIFIGAMSIVFFMKFIEWIYNLIEKSVFLKRKFIRILPKPCLFLFTVLGIILIIVYTYKLYDYFT